jgi:biopolymer transport protein ExbB
MQSLGQILGDAGVVGIPLALFSVVAIALIIERSFFWYRVNRQQAKVISHALMLYKQDPAKAQEKLQRHLHLPMARVFLEALSLDGAEPDELALAIDGAIQAEVPVLKRFSNIFDTIITLSPLLGLLGTVLGLIRSFSSLRLGEVGGAGTVGVTSGISEALVSTAFGLVVAIFTLFFANTFRGFYTRQLAMFQEYAAQLELLHRKQYRQNSEGSYASSHR